MDLKVFLRALPSEGERRAFAERCGTTIGHLRNCTNPQTGKVCSTRLAVVIERESGGAVTRQELREDWRDHWPELAAAEAA